MKSALKLFVAVFFILAVIRSLEAQTYTISGKVRYADNNEIVTRGVVKIYHSNGELAAVAPINQTGDYIGGVVKHFLNEGLDVIGIPDDEWEDYIPTGYPDKTDPAMFTHLNVTENLINIDVYVQRLKATQRPGVTANVNGIILSGNKPVKDAVVYAMQGNEYVGFGISNSKGQYNIKNLPVGDYILVAHKVGCESYSAQVNITEKSENNIGFTLVSKNVNITGTTPYEFALTQNYPNPFNPNTVISYSVAQDGPVSLKVYNTAGEMVTELVNENQAAGIYNISFNASSLSSGVYFYTLVSNSFTATKKMILVK